MATSVEDMTELARALVEADKVVDQLKASLKDAEERARLLREESIPSAMQELGLAELRLLSGQRVRVKQDVYASVPVARRNEAWGWLEERGYGGLIKTQVAVQYGRGELPDAEELAEELLKRGLRTELNRNVHPQTLKAFLREQLSLANNVPLELFGARPVWVAEII